MSLLFPDIVLFPYFLYPVNQVAISGSIFMTVAIAWERYVAVHYPIDYNQAKHELWQFFASARVSVNASVRASASAHASAHVRPHIYTCCRMHFARHMS